MEAAGRATTRPRRTAARGVGLGGRRLPAVRDLARWPPRRAGAGSGPWVRAARCSCAGPLWDELGGLDERFALPGGGLANHDLYRRACELPGHRAGRAARRGHLPPVPRRRGHLPALRRGTRCTRTTSPSATSPTSRPRTGRSTTGSIPDQAIRARGAVGRARHRTGRTPKAAFRATADSVRPMFPFWEVAVAPVLEAARARRIVEIGALRGENTELMLDRPRARRRAARHRPGAGLRPGRARAALRRAGTSSTGTSASTCSPTLPADGRGPRSTATTTGTRCTTSCALLARGAPARAGAPLPVLILHDVGWPYGRRDLYYDPEHDPGGVPPAVRAGRHAPGPQAAAPDGGGLNPTMCNAEMEGGPRNGVMTGARRLHGRARPAAAAASCCPIYFGLAIVVEEERLARAARARGRARPAREPRRQGRAARAGRGRPPAGDDLPAQRVLPARTRAIERLAARYLDSVKRGLLDEHYLENEVRLAHLADCVEQGRAPNLDRAARSRAPRRRTRSARLRELRRSGTASDDDAGRHRLRRTPPWAGSGSTSCERASTRSASEHVRGDLVDCGAGRGGAAIFLRAYLEAHELPGRDGLGRRPRSVPPPTTGPRRDRRRRAHRASARPQPWCATASSASTCSTTDVRFLQGDLDATLADAPIETARAAAHRARPRRDARAPSLEQLLPAARARRLRRRRRRADAECAPRSTAFRDRASTSPRSSSAIGSSATSWRKAARPTARRPPAVAPRRGRAARRSRLPAPTGARDLSVVIVVYNMRREAARIAPRAVPRLPAGHRRPRLRGDRRRERLRPRPAARRGVRTRLRPGVPVPRPRRRRDAVAGERAEPRHPASARARARPDDRRRPRPHARACCATAWPGSPPTRRRSSRPSSGTSGPGQQGDVMRSGYDQAYEDQLFEQIEWPTRRLPAVRDRSLRRRPRLVRRRVGEQLPVRRRASCSSRSAASTRASRWPAAATPTSTSTSGSASSPGRHAS